MQISVSSGLKNYLDHYMYMGYRWTKPSKWYNNFRINYNAGYSRTFEGNQYQSFFTNINANGQLKNLWYVGGFLGYNPEANDFYEAQTGGDKIFRTSRRVIGEVWFETNSAKKYSGGASLNGSHHERFKGRSYYLGFWHKYRFSDKFSLSHEVSYQPFKNGHGFDGRDNGITVFALRDRKTAENELEAKYSFNNKSGIRLSILHYWSEVDKKGYFDLKEDGAIAPYNTSTTYQQRDFTYNQFLLFAEYQRQFAPGSFINIVWKNENDNNSQEANHQYFKNLNNTLTSPHTNNLSFRIIYFLDYLDFKKWKKKKAE